MKRQPVWIATSSMCWALVAITAIAVYGLMGAAASADDTSQAAILEKGQSIAAANCAPCHAIGDSDKAPVPTNELTSFRDLHKRFPILMLTEAVKSGSIEGHDEMPAFDFSVEDMAALLTYIDSFAPDETLKYIPQK